jgi:hypothetical protein
MPSKRRESAAAAPQAVSHFETPVKRFQSRDAPPPPPAISLATGEALQMSRAEREQWCSEEGGQSAARRGPESDQLRLLGTTVLNLSIPNDGPSNTEKASRPIALPGFSPPPHLAIPPPPRSRSCSVSA